MRLLRCTFRAYSNVPYNWFNTTSFRLPSGIMVERGEVELCRSQTDMLFFNRRIMNLDWVEFELWDSYVPGSYEIRCDTRANYCLVNSASVEVFSLVGDVLGELTDIADPLYVTRRYGLKPIATTDLSLHKLAQSHIVSHS